MPKYYDFMICGYYLYFTSHCIVEAMHVHASDPWRITIIKVCKSKTFKVAN